MCEYIELITNQLDNLNSEDLHLYFGKKTRRNNETKYSFFEAQTKENIRDDLKEVLHDNFIKLTNSNIIEQPDPDDEESYIKFDLEDKENWCKFEPYIYSNITNFKEIPETELNNYNKDLNSIESLDKLKSSINHYILIIETAQYIFGQITRVRPKQIFVNDRLHKLFFKDEQFSKFEDDPNLEFDSEDSILFFIDINYKIGFINKYHDFEEIFDINAHNLESAINLIRDNNFNNYCNIDIEEIIEEDRSIQKMLNRELTQIGFENFNLEAAREAYAVFTENNGNVKFEFDGNNFQIDLDNQKESFKSLIKFVGYYYNKSLDGEHIVEGTPRGFVN